MAGQRVLLIVVVVLSTVIVIGAIVLFGVGVLLLGEAVAVIVAVSVVIAGVGVVIDLFRPTPPTCGLVRRAVLPDTCAGACGPDQVCAVVDTRSYAVVLSQASACACVPAEFFDDGGNNDGGDDG